MFLDQNDAGCLGPSTRKVLHRLRRDVSPARAVYRALGIRHVPTREACAVGTVLARAFQELAQTKRHNGVGKGNPRGCGFDPPSGSVPLTLSERLSRALEGDQ